MGDLDLAFIGTGNAFAPGGLCWNGFVAGGRYLFEAPPQALQSLNRMGIDPNELDGVVISHHHGDHFLGLPFLLLHWKYFQRSRPAYIVGPPRTRELAEAICRTVYPGVLDAPYELRWVELAGGESVDLPGIRLSARAVQHDTRLSLNLGYLAELGGRRLAYTGDTGLCDAVLELAAESQVLVAECSSVDERVPIHLNLVDDIPKVRAAMRPASTLILTHLTPDVAAAAPAGTLVARDLERFRL
ncbi:MBL fold metallo-hydrolase [Tepidiforma sp.]|uniref:MBL fold metallo-hydrolase n=1 Tax=Tepidiforma sp. TaxID=2682230 RepID=UPI002ADD691B|nr:MBL fold metallo-hydrolase [Tepidiforma sp.]